MFNNVNVINGAYAVEENPEKEGLNVLVNGVGYYSDWACHRVYHDSPLMQYTGIKDKNGVEIYEGDILKWNAKEWGCEFNEVVEWDFDLLNARKYDWAEWCEVIGNIHENPELLEADK
jgi:uncharacterized phage protein (TIGR01671 family)